MNSTKNRAASAQAKKSVVIITILDNQGKVFDSAQWRHMEDLSIMLQNFADEPAFHPGTCILSSNSTPSDGGEILEAHTINAAYLKEMGIN